MKDLLIKYESLKQLRDGYQQTNMDLVAAQKILNEECLKHEKWQMVIYSVREHFLELLKGQFELVQNMALKDVIPAKSYQFCMEINQRYGKPQVDLEVKKFENNKHVYIKLDSGGDGVKSILRISSLFSTLVFSKRDRVLFIDEETTAISQDHQETNLRDNIFRWIQKCCDDFNIQLILITHDHSAREFAQRVIDVVPEPGTNYAKVSII